MRFVLLSLALICLPPLAGAAVIELDTTSFTSEDSAESVTLANFTLATNTNRTLVVTVGGERSDAIASLTFDGVAMNQVSISNAGQTHTSVWYLDIADSGGAVTGDIALTWSGTNNGFYLGAYSLFNVQAGGAVASDSGGNDTGSDITLAYGSALAGDFIIESAAGQNGTTDPPMTAPTGVSTIFNLRNGGGGGYSAASGHEAIGADGVQNNTWSYNLQAPERSRAAGAMFRAIPEPSAAIIGMLGALLMLRRRK